MMLVACGKSEPMKQERPPVKPEWTAELLYLRGRSVGILEEQLGLEADRATKEWVFRGKNFMPGSKIAVGEASAVAAADGAIELRVPMIPLLGAIELQPLVNQENIDPHLTVAVTPAGEPVQQIPWQPIVMGGLVILDVIAGEAKAGRPLAFAGGDAETPVTTLMLPAPRAVIGSGKTLADVDRLAVNSNATTPMTCKGYVGGIYKEPIDLPVDRSTLRIEFRNRRTGAVMGKGGDIVAPFKCPTKVTTDAYRPGMTIQIPGSQVQEWLETH